MKYIDTLIMHNLARCENPARHQRRFRSEPCTCADLVRIFGMHEYFLVLFKPGIHGSELNVHKVRQNAINVPSGSMSCLSVPYFDGVFCEVAVIMAIVKIFLEQIKGLKISATLFHLPISLKPTLLSLFSIKSLPHTTESLL